MENTAINGHHRRVEIIVLANSILYVGVLSGGDLIFVELCKRIDPSKYDIKVITTDNGKKLWKDIHGIRMVTLPPLFSDEITRRWMVPMLYIYRSILASISTYRLLPTGGRAIIYSSSDFLPDVLPPYLIRLIKRDTPWISRIYHLIPSPSRRKGNYIINTLSFISQRLALSLVRARADLVIVLNNPVKVELMSYGIPEKRLAVLGSAVDLDYIDSIKTDDSKLYDGVFLGRIHPTKGIFDLLEIWKGVVKRLNDARLAIVGGGDRSDIDKLTAKIRENGLGRNVTYLGFLPDNVQKYRILKSSKLFLMTDLEGGWSLATLEAMACGLPVIAYNLEIFGSVYKQGYITVPLYDTRQFSTKIIHLLENGGELDELSRQAREQAKAYRWEQIADQFIQFLEKLVSRP